MRRREARSATKTLAPRGAKGRTSTKKTLRRKRLRHAKKGISILEDVNVDGAQLEQPLKAMCAVDLKKE